MELRGHSVKWSISAAIVIAVVLAVFVMLPRGTRAQTDCQGPDCSVTDNCVGAACPPTPGDDDTGENPGGGTEDVDLGDYGGGCSVTEVPEQGNGATCTYYCHDDKLGFIYDAALHIWVLDEGRSEINGENEFTSVNGVPICNWVLAEEPPCTTITISPGGQITCGGNFSVSASASVPCLTVLRDPYPRGIVSAPNVFWLNGPWSAIGSGSSREWCTPAIRNYTLQVGWQFYPAVEPTWMFDDRTWSHEPVSASGMTATHTFQTSSWGLPANGPSLEGRLELPAYQVQVGTAWQALVRRTWEELERGARKTFACRAGDTQCRELYSLCEDPATDPENDLCYEWFWVFHDTGWIPLDLTQFGYPQRYYVSSAAGDVTMPPPGVAVVPLSQRLCNLPVPIIESQSLLNSPDNVP
jgi:hypothetical protein